MPNGNKMTCKHTTSSMTKSFKKSFKWIVHHILSKFFSVVANCNVQNILKTSWRNCSWPSPEETLEINCHLLMVNNQERSSYRITFKALYQGSFITLSIKCISHLGRFRLWHTVFALVVHVAPSNCPSDDRASIQWHSLKNRLFEDFRHFDITFWLREIKWKSIATYLICKCININ